jgi:hypothetical protein
VRFHFRQSLKTTTVHQDPEIPLKRVFIHITMPPTGPSLTFLSWTPTKKKFKPLSVKNLTVEPSDASNNDEEYSSWSGIHSDSDSEFPPLSYSSSNKPLVAQTWPKPPSLSSFKASSLSKNDHRSTNQEKYVTYIPTTIN